ncbi:MAG: hypothetical protein ACR2ML_08215 [Solirubrobacteraceae bacterium]
MLKERLQILVSRDQRRRLESEAQRRGLSVGGLIREAVDAHLGHVGEAERLEALDGIRAASGRFLAPEELNRIVDGERDAVVDGAVRGFRSR